MIQFIIIALVIVLVLFLIKNHVSIDVSTFLKKEFSVKQGFTAFTVLAANKVAEKLIPLQNSFLKIEKVNLCKLSGRFASYSY